RRSPGEAPLTITNRHGCMQGKVRPAKGARLAPPPGPDGTVVPRIGRGREGGGVPTGRVVRPGGPAEGSDADAGRRGEAAAGAAFRARRPAGVALAPPGGGLLLVPLAGAGAAGQGVLQAGGVGVAPGGVLG